MEFKLIYTNPGEENFYLFDQVAIQLYPIKELPLINKALGPHLKQCIILLLNDIPSGRIALYHNHELSHDGLVTWTLGNYECIENTEASTILLNSACDYTKTRGAEFVIGPMNGSTWENYRFSNSPSTLFLTEALHKSYYPGQFLANGFNVISEYFSSIDDDLNYDKPEVLNLGNKFLKNGIRIRKIDLDNYESELKKLYPFLTEAFSTNHYYTPITFESFMEKYLPLKKLIDPSVVLLAENAKHETLSVFFCLPDLYNIREKTLVIKTIARKNSPDLKGFGHVIGNEIYRNAVSQGYTKIIHAFMHKQGTSVQISKNYSGKLFKEYALYGKKI